MLAEMRGPGNWPLATTVDLVKPSGLNCSFEIVKSVDTVAARARCERDNERSEENRADLNIVSQSEG